MRMRSWKTSRAARVFESINLNFQASAFGLGRRQGRRGGFLEKNLSPQPLENQPLSGKCQKNLKKDAKKFGEKKKARTFATANGKRRFRRRAGRTA
jgi:hypothetical protein